MYCHNCKMEVEEKWNYCPKCGTQIPIKDDHVKPSFVEFSDFRNLLEDIVEGIEEMTNRSIKRQNKKDFEFVIRDFRDLLGLPLEMGGVSIKISSDDVKEPKVDIKTFGNFSGHEDILKKWLEFPDNTKDPQEDLNEEIVPHRQPPKKTQEPQTFIKKIKDGLELRIRVPGVISEEDIDVKQLQESIEVRADRKSVV